MTWWKAYILSIIGCVLICGVVTQIVSDFQSKKLIRLVCGIFLAVTIMGPLPFVDVTHAMVFDTDGLSPETYIAIGKREAQSAQEECIKGVCESYISNRANDFGMIVTANVDLDDNMYPNYARIYAQSDSEYVEVLKQVLEEDLGITKENQAWIWKQEKDSS